MGAQGSDKSSSEVTPRYTLNAPRSTAPKSIVPMTVTPIILSGRWVRLEPLAAEHAQGLFKAGGRDEDIWRYMLDGPMKTVAEMQEWIQAALGRQETGMDLPFCVIDRASGRPAGSTRYMNIAPQDRGLEIGSTWYARVHQRTVANTECKYLLLRHAFETLGCIRVQLKTDSRNLRSQAAIERLGAVQEGVLRKHMVVKGDQRDTVMYSILDREWPAIKSKLEGRLYRNNG